MDFGEYFLSDKVAKLVFSISLSASVDLPWSICAMMAKFLIFSINPEDG
jgi:hypothetical protein